MIFIKNYSFYVWNFSLDSKKMIKFIKLRQILNLFVILYKYFMFYNRNHLNLKKVKILKLIFNIYMFYS